MLVEEPHLEETLCSKELHDIIDEAHETLSLCDLPLYSDQSVECAQDFSSQSHGSQNSLSSSSNEHDYFEFFNPQPNPSANIAASFPPENIVFCGKLIPYKKPPISESDSSALIESQKKTKDYRRSGLSLLTWKLLICSSKSSKGQQLAQDPKMNGTKSATTLMHKKTYNTNKHGEGHGFPIQKISFLTPSSSGKAKWYLFSFGIFRFSRTEVELRDIKSRQSRRRSRNSTPWPPPKMFRFENWDDKVSGRRNRGSWGLWRLICGGDHHSNTNSTAAIG